MEDRLNEVEAKLALAEDLLEELNRTVFRQQQQIDQLQHQLKALAVQMQSGPGADRRDPHEEIPPHY
jgi:SlyX protein